MLLAQEKLAPQSNVGIDSFRLAEQTNKTTNLYNSLKLLFLVCLEGISKSFSSETCDHAYQIKHIVCAMCSKNNDRPQFNM